MKKEVTESSKDGIMKRKSYLANAVASIEAFMLL